MRTLSYAVVMAACGALGCGGMVEVAENSEALAARKGVDYAWGRPSPQTLASGGYTFAARYLSWDTTGKNLSASEAKALIAAGVDVVSTWEYSASAALNGYNQGVNDAKEAQKQALACGAPAGRPIYFSVDFDVSAGQQAAINAYFDGIASVIGASRAGAYGGYYVIKRLFDAGKIQWGWQTYAWSGGQWDSRAQMRQVQNGVTIGGVDCDIDTANADDFGQWGHQPVNASGLPQVSGNDSVTAVNWPDGHAELFPRSTAGERLHVWTNGAGDTWNTAAVLDADSNCGAAASFWGAPWNYAEVFSARSGGGTGHLWWSSGGWNAFQDFKGTDLSHLSTLVWGDGRSEVFALGGDGAIWHNYWNTSVTDWSGWSSMGGALATGASAILWKDGHGELFAVDSAGVAWHNWSGNYPGGWSGWNSLGGSLASHPVPARWADGHVQLFARGTDGHLYQAYYTNNTWSAWQVLSASTTILGEPSVMVNRGNGGGEGPEVFARDAQGAVVHLWWNGSAWTDFIALDTFTAASDPFGWIRGDGRGEVFAIDAHGDLKRIYRDANGWGTWATIASGIDVCTPQPVPPGGGGGGGGGGGAGGGGAGGGGAGGGGAGGGGGDGTGAGGSDGGGSVAGGCAVTGSTATGRGGALALALLAALGLARRRSRRPL